MTATTGTAAAIPVATAAPTTALAATIKSPWSCKKPVGMRLINSVPLHQSRSADLVILQGPSSGGGSIGLSTPQNASTTSVVSSDRASGNRKGHKKHDDDDEVFRTACNCLRTATAAATILFRENLRHNALASMDVPDDHLESIEYTRKHIHPTAICKVWLSHTYRQYRPKGDARDPCQRCRPIELDLRATCLSDTSTRVMILRASGVLQAMIQLDYRQRETSFVPSVHSALYEAIQ
ncbi:hypothetical protein FISHEDRAFT_76798 [Fistulina hepatica ATCC 64428]|uniref:Uncharacterized protein n=1 Tax=Fistulina hepatica ATCC 64428 TaxID=1128425 RepID=A0A0D7A3D8_9AGAR|nr:hypothetical protein FISHEDRAFT_76798 [Fistulina hepatica ATCC 64428]